MAMHTYWLHRTTGWVWATASENGQVTGCCGPLDAEDATPELLPHFGYTTGDVAWLHDHRSEFAALTEEGRIQIMAARRAQQRAVLLVKASKALRDAAAVTRMEVEAARHKRRR